MEWIKLFQSFICTIESSFFNLELLALRSHKVDHPLLSLELDILFEDNTFHIIYDGSVNFAPKLIDENFIFLLASFDILEFPPN